MMVVHPTRTPAGDPLVLALEDGILEVLGHEAEIVASPGTYDHKHVTRIGGVDELCRLRAGSARAGAPARRVVPDRGHGELREGDGPRAAPSRRRVMRRITASTRAPLAGR